MKIKIIFIFLLLEIYNFQNITSSFINNLELKKPENLLNNITKEMSDNFYNLIGVKILSFFFNNLEKIDQECLSFISDVNYQTRNIINNIAQKFAKRGFFSSSMEIEEECIENDEIFILVKGNYSLSYIYKNIENYENQNKLFSEKFTFEREICLWKYCHDIYINQLDIIMINITNIIKTMFNIESLELEGVNYKINKTTKYRDKNKKEDLEYYKILNTCFYIIIVILILCTLFSFCLEGKDENDINQNEEKRKEIEEDSRKSEDTFFSNKSDNKTINNILYKCLSAFNIIKNILIFNKIKESLSNQNSLVELSLITFITIFWILLAENIYIIIKFIDRSSNLYSLLHHHGFVFIKIGFISYEFYKVICGVIFGFKFINYYKKSENFNCKRIFRFISKFIPYFIIFLIIYFVFQYNFENLVLIIDEKMRNNYISRKMNECYYCQKEFYNIFNPLIITQYNTTDSHAAQYDGCLRPTLFTISEFICFIFTILVIVIFSKIKNKFLEIIFFIINITTLFLSYILTPEGKDLEYFTVSRLFGYSASIAIPYLFFPLYYIGFNIGIIYYYNKHQAETYNELNKNENNYLFFEYCYKISLFLKGINGKIKNFILTLCIFFIIGISFYTFTIRKKKELFFESDFWDKFLYVYEGIISGIIFSIFIVIYLSASQDSFFRLILSTQLLSFVNKISFILFNVFITGLKIFHAINIVSIHLSPLNLFLKTISLYTIIWAFVVGLFITIFIPIKWIYFFIMNGFNYEEY